MLNSAVPPTLLVAITGQLEAGQADRFGESGPKILHTRFATSRKSGRGRERIRVGTDRSGPAPDGLGPSAGHPGTRSHRLHERLRKALLDRLRGGGRDPLAPVR